MTLCRIYQLNVRLSIKYQFDILKVIPEESYILKSIICVREHPLNLKGGGELWFFSESKYFFRFAAQQNYFLALFFKAQSANRTFFSAHFTDRNFLFNKICRQNFFFSQKTIALPPFKLNGCFLSKIKKKSHSLHQGANQSFFYVRYIWRYLLSVCCTRKMFFVATTCFSKILRILGFILTSYSIIEAWLAATGKGSFISDLLLVITTDSFGGARRPAAFQSITSKCVLYFCIKSSS